MVVYVVMPNKDNASVGLIGRTIERAKAEAENLAGSVPDGHTREWRLEGESLWLYERDGDSKDWPIFSVEPFTVKD